MTTVPWCTLPTTAHPHPWICSWCNSTNDSILMHLRGSPMLLNCEHITIYMLYHNALFLRYASCSAMIQNLQKYRLFQTGLKALETSRDDWVLFCKLYALN